MDDMMQHLLRIQREADAAKQKRAFKRWCRGLDQLPADYRLVAQPGFKADVELQPKRWLSAGLELLHSCRGTGSIRHFDGTVGEPLHTMLFYPVFQMGTEIFLKGMWLCQFPECRSLAQVGHLDAVKRQHYSGLLVKLGHDLLRILGELRKIPEYQNHATSMRFLKRVEALTRGCYYPLYEADKAHWANARYPKRYYNDTTYEGHADLLRSFPSQKMVLRLFEPMAELLDKRWRLTKGLMSKRRRAKSATP